jgi:hypothetical protein
MSENCPRCGWHPFFQSRVIGVYETYDRCDHCGLEFNHRPTPNFFYDTHEDPPTPDQRPWWMFWLG